MGEFRPLVEEARMFTVECGGDRAAVVDHLERLADYQVNQVAQVKATNALGSIHRHRNNQPTKHIEPRSKTEQSSTSDRQ